MSKNPKKHKVKCNICKKKSNELPLSSLLNRWLYSNGWFALKKFNVRRRDKIYFCSDGCHYKYLKLSELLEGNIRRNNAN